MDPIERGLAVTGGAVEGSLVGVGEVVVVVVEGTRLGQGGGGKLSSSYRCWCSDQS